MTTTIDTTAPSRTTTGNTALNVTGAQTKDMFLKLLVAQMKNQDPSNPAQPEQMAAQLAQFSSPEQLVSIKEAITAQSGDSAAIQATLLGAAAMSAVEKCQLATASAFCSANSVTPGWLPSMRRRATGCPPSS